MRLPRRRSDDTPTDGGVESGLEGAHEEGTAQLDGADLAAPEQPLQSGKVGEHVG